MKNSATGFTLIELSIVLVIIGLIVGGVFVGRDLIRTAELRRVVTQLESYETATMAFRAKYNCLPGDCAKAIERGVDTVNGDGDGRLNWGESFQFFLTLNNTRLAVENVNPAASVYYPFTRAPSLRNPWFNQAKIVPITIFSEFPQGTGCAGDPTEYLGSGFFPNGQYWWIVPGLSGDDYGSATAQAADARYLDSKIDDGLPTTGKFLALNAYVSDPCFVNYPNVTSGDGAQACVDDSTTPAQYNAGAYTEDIYLCGIAIRAGW